MSFDKPDKDRSEKLRKTSFRTKAKGAYMTEKFRLASNTHREWIAIRNRLSRTELRALKITWNRFTGKNKIIATNSLRNVFVRMMQRSIDVKHMFYKAAFIYVFVDSSKTSTILTERDHAHLIFAYIHQAIDFLCDPMNHDVPQSPSQIADCHCHLQSIGMEVTFWEMFGEMLAKEINAHECIRSYPHACRAWNILIAALTDYLHQGFLKGQRTAHEVLFRRLAQRRLPRDQMVNPKLVNPLTDLVMKTTSQCHGALSSNQDLMEQGCSADAYNNEKYSSSGMAPKLDLMRTSSGPPASSKSTKVPPPHRKIGATGMPLDDVTCPGTVPTVSSEQSHTALRKQHSAPVGSATDAQQAPSQSQLRQHDVDRIQATSNSATMTAPKFNRNDFGPISPKQTAARNGGSILKPSPSTPRSRPTGTNQGNIFDCSECARYSISQSITCLLLDQTPPPTTTTPTATTSTTTATTTPVLMRQNAEERCTPTCSPYTVRSFKLNDTVRLHRYLSLGLFPEPEPDQQGAGQQCLSQAGNNSSNSSNNLTVDSGYSGSLHGSWRSVVADKLSPEFSDSICPWSKQLKFTRQIFAECE